MKEQTAIPDAIRFAPLRIAWVSDNDGNGAWCVMTRRDETPGSLNNFSVAECQHKADATFFASAPDLLRQRDKLRDALQAMLNPVNTHFIKRGQLAGCGRVNEKTINQARAILAETEAKP